VNNTNPNSCLETLTGEMLIFKMIGRLLYIYPNDEERTWMQSLIDEDIFSETPLAGERDDTKTGLGLLQKWAKNGISDQVFDEMRADYTRLFIGLNKILATPWESVHLGDDHLVFQKRTLEVRAWYKRFGLESEKIHQEPDDHIGLELMFLSHLSTLGIEAQDHQDNSRFESLLEAQREFIKQHLGVWALTWCGLVEKNARTDFYRGLALLTRGVLFEVSEVLEVKLAKDAAH
jgi:putative dimethyl sulfoxide reductase chaperone